jgi:hypothetical protein
MGRHLYPHLVRRSEFVWSNSGSLAASGLAPLNALVGSSGTVIVYRTLPRFGFLMTGNSRFTHPTLNLHSVQPRLPEYGYPERAVLNQHVVGDKHRVLKARFRGVGVVSAILRNLSRDLGLGIAVMTIVRSFSKAIWRES